MTGARAMCFNHGAFPRTAHSRGPRRGQTAPARAACERHPALEEGMLEPQPRARPARTFPQLLLLSVSCLVCLAHPALAAWQSFSQTDGLASNRVHGIAEDRAGRYWFVTPEGVSRFDGLRWERQVRVADTILAANAVLEDRSGNLWFSGSQLLRYDGRGWRQFTTADGLPGDGAGAMAEDAAGNLWFATGYGATRFDGTSWRTFSTSDGLGDNFI